jgi:5-methylcytosine-specific restriction endonuclease McrA
MMTRNVLELPTLVLNRNWQPVHVTTVVRALVMLWNETAKAVEPDEYRLYDWADWSELEPADGRPCVRSARRCLRAPEVICLAHYDRLPGAAVTFSRRNVAKRDHHTCQYCGAQPGGEAITIDHVVPRSQGGASSWTNCVAACIRCNARKADRTPEQAGMHLRKRPARPDWKPLYAAQGARVASWSKFLAGEPTLARTGLNRPPPRQEPGRFTGACSWESNGPPKPAHRVRILAPLLPPTWPNGEAPAL